ncbi:olfactory receptor 10W1-like [Ovis canadensis]|uniref:olfactory receptor 10W1-like n=1 Tax=Ovis canadensis TaxID=37174 RepID=UPI003752A297
MEFVLLAYPSQSELCILSFLGVSLVYTWVITGNVLIMVAIQTEAHLPRPMYYLLGSLSGVETGYTAVVVPHILANILRSEKTITLLGCATQMGFFVGRGSANCFLLASMAYDRHAAVCHPLQCPLIMPPTLCACLVAASVALGLCLSSQRAALVFSLPFCPARGVRHFYCDVPPVRCLVCAQSHRHEESVLVAATLAIAVPFLLIAASYASIVAAVLRAHSAAGRRRAFSACSSHLAVVWLQYGCCAFMYLRPSSSYHPEQDRFVSLVHTLGTPLLNPFVYPLRNSEMKGAIARVLTRNRLPQEKEQGYVEAAQRQRGCSWASLMTQQVKNRPAVQETEEMRIRSSTDSRVHGLLGLQCVDSVAVVPRLSWPAACGTSPEQHVGHPQSSTWDTPRAARGTSPEQHVGHPQSSTWDIPRAARGTPPEQYVGHPQSRDQPACPALASGLFTTGPPKKSFSTFLNELILEK